VRLWSLHPRYLDRQGLVALWREGLLAQSVLGDLTKGYRRHPQLDRFRASGRPLPAVATFLHGVHAEAMLRGFSFDVTRIAVPPETLVIEVTDGQVEYEWGHLLAKLRGRNPTLAVEHAGVKSPQVHPLFRVVEGPIAEWERR
jgi:hypothetical protein